jgi:hypothetical protein
MSGASINPWFYRIGFNERALPAPVTELSR